MKVTIDDSFREFIEKKIKSGDFRNADEVVSAAVNRWADEEVDFAPGEIEELLRPALEQMKRGEGIAHDEAMRRLDEYIANQTKQRKGA